MGQGQIGNPDGADKPNKKFYDLICEVQESFLTSRRTVSFLNSCHRDMSSVCPSSPYSLKPSSLPNSQSLLRSSSMMSCMMERSWSCSMPSLLEMPDTSSATLIADNFLTKFEDNFLCVETFLVDSFLSAMVNTPAVTPHVHCVDTT